MDNLILAQIWKVKTKAHDLHIMRHKKSVLTVRVCHDVTVPLCHKLVLDDSKSFHLVLYIDV